MRRPSIKPLSLALSLLLAITVLFSLSLPVWADTEVPGDLNGDTLVDANDVTILEAVLDGSQTAAAGVNYDISGNKMVDSEDLTVLKNMVDPSQPALADKLADGTTDDLLELVSTVTGGQLQRAVVRGGGTITSDCPRGSSTRALDLAGGTMTVLFAEIQNWSDKAALELDTLWVSGDRAVTVLLLGTDGETILGTPIVVTAEENGWSRISLPLTGILAKERAKIGGIMVTVADDAHVYMDNLALIVAEEAEDVLTRADLENALAEMAWNWYFKGSAYEYDSTPLNSDSQSLSQPLAGYGGGKSRLTLFPTLEDATSHSSVFTVCSGFAYDTYLTALGYPILGAKYNSLTMTFWRNSSYYPAGEDVYDMTILRWHTKGQNTSYYEGASADYDTEFSTYDTENGNIVYRNWYNADGVKEFFQNYEENFRPGDIIVFDSPGHTVVYIGNGIVMDDNGAKYDMTTGADSRELNGSLVYNSFYDRFLNPANTTMNLEIALGKATNHVVVLRPLNLLTIDDGDGDPSNDKLNPDYVLNTGLLKYQLDFDKTNEVKTSGYGIDETTATRLQYPGMNIDRTVNIKPYGTAVKGDTITYSVKITNNSSNDKYVAFRQSGGDTGYAGEDYENLWVVEHIPANTEFVEAPGATRVGDTLRWNITVPAGETVELTYTVTVTGEIGDEIVSGGGWVNNIPSNTITNIIGGKKLSTDHQDAMAAIDIATITDITDGTDLAEQIYKNATGQDLQLPAVQDIMDIFFSEYKYTTPYGYYLYYNSTGITRYMYTLNAKAPSIESKLYYDMLVPNYYGGMWCYTDEYNGEPRITELREEYLEVGDILVYMDLTPSTDYGKTSQARVVEGYTVLVYLGNGTFASVDQDGALTTRTDAIAYTEAFKHDLFLCLRPSQVYENLSDGIPTYTVKWENAEGEVVETDANVPYRVVPTFDGTAPIKDGYTFTGWSPAVRPATGDITYKPVFIARDLADHKLTDSELDALAAITPKTVQEAFAYYALTSTNLHEVLPWIYEQIGLSVPDTLSTNKIYATAQKFFTLSGLYWTPNSTVATPYTTMLVTNAYGGTQMNNAPKFDIGYLQIGDIFCAAYDNQQTKVGNTIYHTYLYQGDGKFLCISEDSAVCTVEEVLNRTYTYKETDYNWSYYFVIRPENYNSATRDITLRNLTDAERYHLSKLTTDEIKYPSYHLQANAIRFYSLIGINDCMSLTGVTTVTHSTASELMFTTGSSRVPRKGETDNQRYYQKMLIPCYGGSYVANDLSLTDAIDNSILQIGDIVAGVIKDGYTDENGTTGSADTQFTALYQGIDETGKGKFVILYRDYTTSSSAYSNYTTVLYADEIDKRISTYYYTLRPEMLAAETQDTYTVTWVDDDGTVLKTEDVAAYTLPNNSEPPTKAADAAFTYTFAGWTPLTTSVNRDVTYTATYTKTVRSYTVTWLNADGTKLETDENVPYGTVPTYDGKTPAKAADGEFAYDFAGWDQEIAEVTGDVTYTATFFSIRDLAAHKLTEEEMAALAAITPEAAQAALTHVNLTNVAPWIYRQAKIDYSSSHGLATVYSTITKLFDKNGLYWNLKDSIAAPYTTMLVPGTYGGTQMTDAPAFKLGYLQVGDFFCAAYDNEQTNTGSTAYYVYLYQGDGNFLLLRDDFEVVRWYEVLSRTYTCDSGVYNWSYYFAIRPENYNGATRDIALRDLTDAEKYALSKLDNSVVTMGSMHLHTTLPRYFQKVGITMDMKSQTHDGTLGQLFVWSSSVGGRILVEATTDNMRYFQKLMVGCYGGTDFPEASRLTLTDAIAANVLQIGDVIAGKYADTEAGTTASSFTALYQGNGNFLVQYHKYDADAAAQTYQTVSLTAAQIDGLTFKYYFTLRPSKLATVNDEDTFTVTWVNEDGTVLETDENVALYAHPSYDSDVVPTKAPTTHYTYTHKGWTPLPSAINSDVTYKATYSYVRNIIAHELTDGEQKALSKLDINSTLCPAGVDLNSILAPVYKAVGVDITTAYGYVADTGNNVRKALFGNTNCKPLTAETTPNADLFNFYRHMLVDGVYGGSAFAEPGNKALSDENLQIGDIFCAQVPASRVVGSYTFGTGNSYFVLVYQGNGQFDGCLNVSKTGTTKASGDWNGATLEQMQKIAEANAFGYYYVLRPNMLSIPRTVTWVNDDGTVLETNTISYGTVPTYDGTPTKANPAEGYTYTFAGWDTEPVVATGDATYTATYSHVRDLTAHKLTNGELAALAAITPEDVANSLSGTNLGAVGPWAYNQANIEYSSAYGGVDSVYNTMSTFFTLSSQRWTLKTSVDAAYASMLVPNTYGGTQVNDAPAFDVNYLQVGDIFCAAYDKQQTGVSTTYYVYLYQGDGNFLLLRSGSAVFSYTDVLSRTYSGSNGTFNWSYYFVIRPENYNGAKRDIALRNLTSAEKYQLSKLTTMGYPTRNLYGAMPAYYEAIGITMATTKAYNKTHEGARDMLFDWSNSVLVPVEATNDTMRHFQKMAVGVQGGSNFAVANRKDISDAIDGGVLQVGDILAGYHRNAYTLDGAEKSEDVVFTAMYQGNNTFLVYYFAMNESTGKQEMSRTTWTTDQIEALEFYWFYTLRPDNLAN